MINQYNLDEKVAIVTGGSRGIGKEIARNLLISGAKVALLSRSEESLKKTCNELSKIGDVTYFSVNVKNYSDIQANVKKIINIWGKVDILINNAGITDDKLAIRMSEKNWDEVININLKAG